MLVGTWRTPDGGTLRLDALDPDTGIGTCAASAPRQKVYRHTYRILSVQESERTARIEIRFEDPTLPPSVQELTLSPDGRTAERRILSTGFTFLQFFRMDLLPADTLVFVDPA